MLERSYLIIELADDMIILRDLIFHGLVLGLNLSFGLFHFLKIAAQLPIFLLHQLIKFDIILHICNL
jgi:hypothetical protein